MKPITFTSLLFNAGLFLTSPVLASHLNQFSKRAACGDSAGNCAPGLCCSKQGFCSTSPTDCAPGNCQIQFSDNCAPWPPPPGEPTDNIPRPHVGKVPYGTPITRCKKPKTMALTFDDGPSNYTSQLLDLLDKYQVKATFFVCGAGLNNEKVRIDDPARPWRSILTRMYQAGHQIGTHSWSHQKLHKVNSTIRRNEMIYNEMAFRNIFGFAPIYMRAPYFGCDVGSGCLDYMNQLGYHVIDSNLRTYDGRAGSAEDRFIQAFTADPNYKYGYITLAHDTIPNTVLELAEYMITTALSAGFTFLTVGECLEDPRENWYRDASNVTLSQSSSSSQVSLAVAPKSSSGSTRPSVSQTSTSTTTSPKSTTLSKSTTSPKFSSSSKSATSSIKTTSSGNPSSPRKTTTTIKTTSSRKSTSSVKSTSTKKTTSSRKTTSTSTSRKSTSTPRQTSTSRRK